MYNIFFILERARLTKAYSDVQDATAGKTNVVHKQESYSSCEFAGFDKLNLPGLPPRYADLVLPPDWYVPTSKTSKRKHVATNGMQNFVSLAQTVAENWRVVDTITLNYCKTVAQIIKERHTELTKGGEEDEILQHSKQQRKTKKSRTTTKVKSIGKSSARPICISPPPPSSTVNKQIVTPEANGEVGRSSKETDREQLDQQWIEQITSMPSISFTNLMKNEQTSRLYIQDGKHLEEISTMLPDESSSSMVTPLAEDMPTVDFLLSSDDLDNLSVNDFRLF